MPSSDEPSPAPPSRLRATLALGLLALLAGGAYLFHLESRVAELDSAGEPSAPAAPTTAPAAVAAADPPGAVLTPAQMKTMVDVLGRETDPARAVWLQVQRNNPRTAALAGELKNAFEQAGWPTQVLTAPYPLKQGLFLLVGDSRPAAWVDAVSEAFSQAGMEVPYLVGYRDFVRERKNANPSWVGPELADDQAFVIAVGGPPPMVSPE